MTDDCLHPPLMQHAAQLRAAELTQFTKRPHIATRCGDHWHPFLLHQSATPLDRLPLTNVRKLR